MRGKKRLKRLLMCLVLFSVSALLLVHLRLAPLAQTLAVTQVKNEASNLITNAIDHEIMNGHINYDAIVTLEKDSTGKIIALTTNMAEINRLRKEILEIINAEVLELNVYQLGIPIGNILFSDLLAGRGPRISVEIVAINNANASFSSNFTEAGINQTLHQITMNISMDITVLAANGTQTATVNMDVVVAQTVIVGDVPTSYLNMQTKESE